jgi:hypothetical protein
MLLRTRSLGRKFQQLSPEAEKVDCRAAWTERIILDDPPEFREGH